MTDTATLLRVRDLSVSFGIGATAVQAVRDVSFEVKRGETLCIVGESGSGKSMTAFSIMNLLPNSAHRNAAQLSFRGQEISTLSDPDMEGLRGNKMSMIFQEPMTALNPSWTIGEQLIEGCRRHNPGLSRAAAKARAIELMEICGISNAAEWIRQYPHQFSGGMRQRAMIAMALMTEPDLLIADEPTTALDVTIAAQVLDLMCELQNKLDFAIILISHDFGVVHRVADKIAVMYRGEIVETGNRDDIILRPQHPYTQALLDAIPSAKDKTATAKATAEPATAAFALKVTAVEKDYRVKKGLFGAPHRVKAVQGIDLKLPRGEALGIVGESGSGKSTLARMMLGFEAPTRGSVRINGKPFSKLNRLERAKLVQPIFQDPFSSLNPMRSVLDTIRMPLDIHNIGSRKERDAAAYRMMDLCGLAASMAGNQPSQMSGGQRQRVAIASALILQPEIVICDEPTSALDVLVQAQILRLLNDLRREFNLTFVMITHDLNVIRAFADRIAVMYQGRIIEQGATESLFSNPREDYTKLLLQTSMLPHRSRRAELKTG